MSTDNLKASLKTPSITSDPDVNASDNIKATPGIRAAEAYVRPSPIATRGDIISSGFDLRTCVFTLELECKQGSTDDVPTEVFLPEFHFPRKEVQIEVSSGTWTISVDDHEGSLTQRLEWVHGAGKHSLRVKGIHWPQGQAYINDEDAGYLEQCRRSTCLVM